MIVRATLAALLCATGAQARCPAAPPAAPLAAYYACDDAARTRVLGPSEAVLCGVAYAELKTAFGGYAAFKRWERCDPAAVERLRDALGGPERRAAAAG